MAKRKTDVSVSDSADSAVTDYDRLTYAITDPYLAWGLRVQIMRKYGSGVTESQLETALDLFKTTWEDRLTQAERLGIKDAHTYVWEIVARVRSGESETVKLLEGLLTKKASERKAALAKLNAPASAPANTSTAVKV